MPWRQEVTFQLVKRASLLLNPKLINTVICRFWLKASTSLPVLRGLEKRRFWVTQDNQKSGPFFLLICLEATNLPKIHPNVWAKLLPKNAESPLPVDGGRSKKVFAQAPYYLHEARVAGVWRRASAWRVFSRNFILPFCSLETSATRVTLRRNIFNNVKWRWFRRLEVKSRINEVGCWNTLTFRHVKTWTVHSISVPSKQTGRYATNYEQSEANACYEGDVRVGVIPNPTFKRASSSRTIESG